MIESFTWRCGSGPEALPDVREWSGVPSVGPGVVGRLLRTSRSGREALPEFREWLGGPPGGPRLVGMPSRKSGSGREALP